MLVETRRRSHRDLRVPAADRESEAVRLGKRPQGGTWARLFSQLFHRRGALMLGASICAVVLGSVRSEAQNGTILSTLTGPALDNETDISDACAATDGTVWVASGQSGNVIHLDAGLTVVPADTIPHHHGEFDFFSNPITVRGIAFRTDTLTLVTLGRRKPTGAAGSFELREVQTDGTEVGGVPIVVNVDANVSDLFGLTWNPSTNQLMTVDCSNDQVIMINMDGTVGSSFSLPGDVPDYTTLHSGGLAFETGSPTNYVHVTLGDIFTTGPSRIERLILSGASTGISTPIPASIDTTTLRGVEIVSVAANDAFLVMTPDTIYVVDRENVVSAPVSDVECSVNQSGDVEIQWAANGPLAGKRYPFGVRVLRDGQLLAQGIQDDMFTDQDPPVPAAPEALNDVLYCIESTDFDGTFGQAVCCSVQVPRGGLISWAPFPGKQAFDIAHDPSTGNFYVTDKFGDGAIWVLDQDLVPVPSTPEVPNPIPSPFGTLAPTGIAYVSPRSVKDPADPNDPNPETPFLMVIKEDSVLMRRVGLDGTSLTGDIPMGVSDNVTSGISYNPFTEELSYIDSGHSPDRQLVSISILGTVQTQVLPPAFLTGVLHNGVAVAGIDANDFTLYSTFGDAPDAPFDDTVRLIRIQPSGPPLSPGGINIPLESPRGETAGLRDAVGGGEIVGILAYVVNSQANASFVILLEDRGEPFCRGDVDGTQTTDITDVFLLASYLFIENADPIPCEDAGDVNDDGSLSIADPICLVFFMFNGNCPIAPPVCPDPGPGFDPTLDSLGCEGTAGTP